MAWVRKFVLNLHGYPCTYFAGDWIRGELLLELTRATKISRLIVQLQGTCTTEPITADENTVSLKPSEQYLDLELPLEFPSTFPDKTVPVGGHIIPFRIQLPSVQSQNLNKYEFPDRTLPSSFSSDGAVIVYTIWGVLFSYRDYKGSYKYLDVPDAQTDRTTIQFVGASDMNRLTTSAYAMNPYEFEDCNENIACFKSTGLVSVYFKIPRLAYKPLEGIPVTLKVENQSKSDITGICVRLCQTRRLKIKLKHTAFDNSTERSKPIASMPNDPDAASQYGAHVVDTFTCKKRSVLQWNGKELSLVGVPPILFGCSLIQIEYFLKLSVPGICKIEIPIFIGTVLPASSTPQSNQGQSETASGQSSNQLLEHSPAGQISFRKSSFRESPPSYNEVMGADRGCVQPSAPDCF